MFIFERDMPCLRFTEKDGLTKLANFDPVQQVGTYIRHPNGNWLLRSKPNKQGKRWREVRKSKLPKVILVHALILGIQC